jgi:hypothetical protein
MADYKSPVGDDHACRFWPFCCGPPGIELVYVVALVVFMAVIGVAFMAAIGVAFMAAIGVTFVPSAFAGV